ncbi:uncharacterized protein TRIVIDRAFT_223558 [Trichoderma virens Gv29-8]|uniref:C2H2-type domain-containing protein n=1 Tax=Hypocrea virens (strain Gv29-8 / FGSC 10586) TaxID=413071 RepID=G9MXG6_HYPVG|nr:uncharacterized protein TRIVIDRAFT_223558 [Trichoderma virens Gv29-8]EHK20864.1 hypothetical protein TRIVIDRAFT_223558 [Trichoderma virens Gv29-8]UKZ56869.1 hypothetical protein TrVGV298_010714 [Trichoderma virens]
MTGRIASAVDLCRESFEEASKVLRAYERNNSINERVKHESDRFQSWTKQNGAHKLNMGSLDEKLRDSAHLRDVVIDCLEHLASTLMRISQLASSSLHEQDSILKQYAGGSVEATRNSVEISDAEFSDEELLKDTDQVEMLCRSIAHTTTNLTKLSVTFHNPVPIDRYRKAAKVDIYDFEKRDREYVDSVFPILSPTLKERMVQSILSRRRFLQYCKVHHLKLAGGFVVNTETNDRSEESIKTFENYSETTASRPPDIDDFNDPEAPKQYINTDIEDLHSITSYASDTNDSSRPCLPAPPHELGVEPFPCPYCYLYISPKTTKEWRDHVASDLQPYICTFEDCRNPDELYGSRSKWFEHEQTHHRQSLACIQNQCLASFSTFQDFETHLSRDHKEAHRRPSAADGLWVSRYYYWDHGNEDEEDDNDVTPVDFIKPTSDPMENCEVAEKKNLRHNSITSPNNVDKLYRKNSWFFTRRLLDINGPAKLGSLIEDPLDPETVLVPPITDVVPLNVPQAQETNDVNLEERSTKSWSFGVSFRKILGWKIEKSTSKRHSLEVEKLERVVFSPTEEYISMLVKALPPSKKHQFRVRNRPFYVLTGVMVGKGLKFNSIMRNATSSSKNSDLDFLQTWAESQIEGRNGECFEGDGIIGYRLTKVQIRG